MSELSEHVKKAMSEKKEHGIHVGRPARFMFAEDVSSAPEGRVGESTIIRSEKEIFDYARNGFSLYFVAKLLGIGYNVLIFEMKEACPGNPRYKGTKDRFTLYNNIKNGKVGGDNYGE